MKLQFCGAAGTTTGSQHLIEVNGQRILLDCGLYQGKREESIERNRRFSFDPADIDAVVLSHCHIDHSGNLPNLVRQGFRGNIHCTSATRDLCAIMLPDSAHIQESDVEYLNRKYAHQGKPQIEPIYTQADAEAVLPLMHTQGYHRTSHIAKGVQLTFIDAGHVLGSAQVVLDIDDHATGKTSRLLFSGDIGRPNNDLLRDAEPCDNVDFVIMESTYGGRTHEMATQTSDRIIDIIQRTVAQNGKIIIPAFAVERTQQLLYALDRMQFEGTLPRIDVFVDSPLAVNATHIFRLHPESLKPEVKNALFMKDKPFGFEGLQLIRDVADSKQLNERREPCIIISASGMAESGRIVHHLRNNLHDPKNTILFVGYCAEQTLGWKLRQGMSPVRIFGQEVHVRAQIEILDSFSGHADHDELIEWFHHITGDKRRVFLVHGEPKRSEALREALHIEHEQGKVEVAKLLQTVQL
jgi:metallo-beta-lactamase family protein